MDVAWIEQLVASPFMLPLLLLLVVGDAFLVVLPSETAVVALGALSASTGTPNPAAVVGVAAVGAVLGDSACFALGRWFGELRWRWQREGRIARALSRVRSTVLARPAVLIFTARYIPFARISVNLSAGAAGMPYGRFLPLSAVAGAGWALYNTGVGLFFGTVLASTPVLAVLVSVAVAVALGLTVDAVARNLSRTK